MRTSLVMLAVAAAIQAVPGYCNGPAISDEIVLDHGFRYHDDDLYWNERCAVAIGGTTVLLAFSEFSGGEIWGYRRTALGTEIDINRRNLGPASERIGPFDLSDFDGLGWKMAYLSDWDRDGPRSLWVRDLDPETLDSTMTAVRIVPPGGYLRSPVITFAGDRHVVAWVEGHGTPGVLRLTRISRELEILDESPILVASDLGYGIIDLAMDETGGLVA